ncbi:unnamed protein product, partial [Ectocarpus fasciculatus]
AAAGGAARAVARPGRGKWDDRTDGWIISVRDREAAYDGTESPQAARTRSGRDRKACNGKNRREATKEGLESSVGVRSSCSS